MCPIVVVGGITAKLSLRKPKKENMQPRKKIRNLSGFKYRYPNVLKVPYIVYILHCQERVHPWA
jgi:hypothetical protein